MFTQLNAFLTETNEHLDEVYLIRQGSVELNKSSPYVQSWLGSADDREAQITLNHIHISDFLCGFSITETGVEDFKTAGLLLEDWLRGLLMRRYGNRFVVETYFCEDDLPDSHVTYYLADD